MTARSFISSYRNCRRFLAATHHTAILNNYARDLQVLHFTMEPGVPDLLAGAHSFDDLDPGPIEFGIMFGAYEHAANHSRGLAWYQSIDFNGAYKTHFATFPENEPKIQPKWIKTSEVRIYSQFRKSTLPCKKRTLRKQETSRDRQKRPANA